MIAEEFTEEPQSNGIEVFPKKLPDECLEELPDELLGIPGDVS